MLQTQIFSSLGIGQYFISQSEKRGDDYDVWEKISEISAMQVGIQNGSLKRIPNSELLFSKGQKVVLLYLPLIKS